MVPRRHPDRLHHVRGGCRELDREPPDRPSGAQWTEGPKIVDRLNYRSDRQGFVDTSHSHIFVVPADGGTPRQLTDGEWDHSGPRWAPDGSEIFFSSLREEEADWMWRESEVYAVNVDDRRLSATHDPARPGLWPRALAGWAPHRLSGTGLVHGHVRGERPLRHEFRRLQPPAHRRGAGPLPRQPDLGPGRESASTSTPHMKGTSNVWFAPLQGEARARDGGQPHALLHLHGR